jgi:hypothetical protein
MEDPDTCYPTGTGWKIFKNGEDEMRSYHNFRDVPKEQWCYSLHCLPHAGGCGAEMHGDSKEEVIENWNRRT